MILSIFAFFSNILKKNRLKMIIDMSYQGYLSPKCPKAHFRGKIVTPRRILDDFLLFDRHIAVVDCRYC